VDLPPPPDDEPVDAALLAAELEHVRARYADVLARLGDWR
jgi:hypothetical protein